VAGQDLPRIHVETRPAWRAWLHEHHASAAGAWLVSWKAATGRPAVGYGAAVEEALCFGWVDSLPRRLDDERGMLRFTPRKPGSNWSGPNRERVERTIANGLMAPAGLAAVERAHADGTWTALEAVEALIVPDDLAAAFAAHPGSAAHWDVFPRSARRGILEWILAAKRPETRERRVLETARLAAENRRANQWRGR